MHVHYHSIAILLLLLPIVVLSSTAPTLDLIHHYSIDLPSLATSFPFPLPHPTSPPTSTRKAAGSRLSSPPAGEQRVCGFAQRSITRMHAWARTRAAAASRQAYLHDGYTPNSTVFAFLTGATNQRVRRASNGKKRLARKSY